MYGIAEIKSMNQIKDRCSVCGAKNVAFIGGKCIPCHIQKNEKILLDKS